jgi:endo-alpha-1,4-polygalactosaminidase (GH114 family)
MIDAEFRSEERFSRLALAYESGTEKDEVNSCVDRIIAKNSMVPEIYTTKVSNGKEVLVIEYHDDIARESGSIFEEIIKTLNVTVCN